MLYHIRVSTRSIPQHDETKLGLSEQDVLADILVPLELGQVFVVNGRKIEASDVSRCRVSASTKSVDQLLHEVEAGREGSRVFTPIPIEWDAAALCTDVSDRMIGKARDIADLCREENKPMPTLITSANNRKVFVVHGRNAPLASALFEFLQALDLRPLEWDELVRMTGEPNPYIGDVLAKGFEVAQAAVVLFSGDDEAQLREEFRGPHDDSFESVLTPQARPNVILEAGMALAYFPKRTVLVQVGKLRPMSDLSGKHLVFLDDSTEKRKAVAQRLEAAGCPVNTSGNKWLSAGKFAKAQAPSSSPKKSGSSSDGEQLDQYQEDLLLRLLYGDHSCVIVDSPKSGKRVEVGVAAMCDLKNREVAVDYVLACHELKSAGLIESSRIDDDGHWYVLSEKGLAKASSLRRVGKTIEQKTWPNRTTPSPKDNW